MVSSYYFLEQWALLKETIVLPVNNNNTPTTTVNPILTSKREEALHVTTSDKPAASLKGGVNGNGLNLNTRPQFRIGPGTNGTSGSIGRGVSWAQPIEQRLSPEEEDSAGSDTPLYENSGASNGGNNQHLTPELVGVHINNGGGRPGLKKEASFSGLTSRLAAALPFIRNSLGRSSSSLGTKDLEGMRNKRKVSKP